MGRLFEEEPEAKKGFLVSVWDYKTTREESLSLEKELLGLSSVLGLVTAGQELVHVRDKQPKYGMSKEQAQEICGKAEAAKAECVVLNYELSPAQLERWEELTKLPIVDRQELIIEVFAARATTREGDLQAKLAQLLFSLPRLNHRYVDLSRKREGRYGTRGQGQMLLEGRRLMVEKKISKIEKELNDIKKRRNVQRRRREREGMSVCVFVGYTNCGKSSLIKALTRVDVHIEDQLFTTFDPAVRRLVLDPPHDPWAAEEGRDPPPPRECLLVDTVGFIRRLPRTLLRAFRSTLEEVSEADILIHVLDCSDPDIEGHYQTTCDMLADLGAGTVPTFLVVNKVDKVIAVEVERAMYTYPECYLASALDGTGIGLLRRRLSGALWPYGY